MTKLCGIYCITHIESGLKYVGQSIDIKTRLSTHSRTRCDTRISNAITKYGWGAFSTEILEICEQAELNNAEFRWISELNSISPNGYNLTSGGELRIPNKETRAKMSAAKAGYHMPEKTRAAVAAANLGRIRTKESKQKTSSALMNRSFSDETRRKMSESAKLRYASGYGAILVSLAAQANRK